MLPQFVLLLTLVSAPYIGLAKSDKRRLVTFGNSYRGLQPGRSTLKDAAAALGPCVSSQATSNGRNYRFARAVVNISGPDRVHINTIIIDRDVSFRTKAGIKLGDTVVAAKKRLLRRKDLDGCLYDTSDGVFYWHAAGRIRRITLVHQAYVW